METKKEKPQSEETIFIVNEMIKKHGLYFLSNFEDLTKDKPLYAGLCYYKGETKLTPLFSSEAKAKDFVDLCDNHVASFVNVKVKIIKLSLV